MGDEGSDVFALPYETTDDRRSQLAVDAFDLTLECLDTRSRNSQGKQRAIISAGDLSLVRHQAARTPLTLLCNIIQSINIVLVLINLSLVLYSQSLELIIFLLKKIFEPLSSDNIAVPLGCFSIFMVTEMSQYTQSTVAHLSHDFKLTIFKIKNWVI